MILVGLLTINEKTSALPTSKLILLSTRLVDLFMISSIKCIHSPKNVTPNFVALFLSVKGNNILGNVRERERDNWTVLFLVTIRLVFTQFANTRS